MLTKFDWGVDSNERLCYNTGILFLCFSPIFDFWGVDSNERLCYNTGILFLCFSPIFVFREEMWRLDFGKGGWTE